MPSDRLPKQHTLENIVTKMEFFPSEEKVLEAIRNHQPVKYRVVTNSKIFFSTNLKKLKGAAVDDGFFEIREGYLLFDHRKYGEVKARIKDLEVFQHTSRMIKDWLRLNKIEVE